MKKFGMVLGAAAIAAIAGCKDPNYRRGGTPGGQNAVKSADTTVAQTETQPVKAENQCKCAPGTRHTSPCACGGANCYCIVEQKAATPVQPVAVQPTKVEQPAKVEPPKVEPEMTIYVVQSGDYLAKISKKFNVTIAAIKRANGLTSDVVRVGQKLKIPGKFDVSAAAASAQAKPAVGCVKAKAAAVAAPYTGATKEYVVKSGDTLGAIAYGNGITIRQLKELNGLTNDVVRVGQKLKIPAEKQVKAVTKKSGKTAADKTAKAAPAAATAKPAADEKPAAEEKPVEEAKPVAEEKPAEETKPAEEPKAETAAAAPAPATIEYIVQEGDDMTGVSIRFGVSAAEIRELNNLGDADQLKPGRVIKLPAEAQQ